MLLSLEIMLALEASGAAVKCGMVVGVERVCACSRFRNRCLLGLLIRCVSRSVHRIVTEAMGSDIPETRGGQGRRQEITNQTYCLRLRLLSGLSITAGDIFDNKLHKEKMDEKLRHNVKRRKTHLSSCTPSQSVVHRVLLTNESAITFLNSACAASLFESVICPRQRATHSLRYNCSLVRKIWMKKREMRRT